MIRVLKGRVGRVYSVAISNNDQYVVSGSENSTIRVCNIVSEYQIRVFQGRSGFFIQLNFKDDIA